MVKCCDQIKNTLKSIISKCYDQIKGSEELYENYIKAKDICSKKHMRIFYVIQWCPKISNKILTFYGSFGFLARPGKDISYQISS